MSDLIDREQALACFWNYADTDGTGYDETDTPAYDRLQALPIVVGVEDCISRQAAIDAVAEGLKRIVVEYRDVAEKMLNKVPSAQPDLQPTCNKLATDCISRQDVIRWIKIECNPYGSPTLDFESGKKVIAYLERMPSAQPETSRIENALHGKSAEEQYEFIWWLLQNYAMNFTDSRRAAIEWLKGGQDDRT